MKASNNPFNLEKVNILGNPINLNSKKIEIMKVIILIKRLIYIYFLYIKIIK